jgi:hypothetical protein
MKNTAKVSSRLINMMVKAYGTIEAAREAYKAVKSQLKPGFHVIVMTGPGRDGRLGMIDGRGNQLTDIEWMFILP